jgi:hypothetical protein
MEKEMGRKMTSKRVKEWTNGRMTEEEDEEKEERERRKRKQKL